LPPIRLVRLLLPRLLLWLALAAWAIPRPAAAESYYTVKRGDSLYSIAHSHGIPMSVLAEQNGLGRSAYISVGQKLRLPSGVSTNSDSAPIQKERKHSVGGALPASIQRAITVAEVEPGRWQYIVIHHSGVDVGTVKGMDRYHREIRHMENGLAYHFVIGNGHGMGDGEIAVGHRWTAQINGGHLASEEQDRIALGICLVGNFELHKPTARQMESLRVLVQALMTRCKLERSAVKTHRQINIIGTRCPGAKFPTKSFLNSLQS
jgi:murein DD-endopeptidase MepM/ murein hydrolase activator NlpD